MVLASVVKAGGGDLSEVQISKSLVHRKRRKVGAKQGKKSWFLLFTAVLYSGCVLQQPYLLGIPKFESSKGKDIEAGVLKELEK